MDHGSIITLTYYVSVFGTTYCWHYVILSVIEAEDEPRW